MGETDTYTMKAYRFNPLERKGILFIEASKDWNTTGVQITIAVQPDLEDFPGIVLIEPLGDPNWTAEVLALRDREILGGKANVYYHPTGSADLSLNASASPGDMNRSNYLNAIYSAPVEDGATGDTVQGSIFACTLHPQIPLSMNGTDLGTVDLTATLIGCGGETPTLYQVEEIDLDYSETLTVDTTNGPVYIFIKNGDTPEDGIVLEDNAQILNVRSDGQPPHVGDLRILTDFSDRITLNDQTWIQGAFIYSPFDELRLLTTGPGCPGGQNTNVEGVVWVEA